MVYQGLSYEIAEVMPEAVATGRFGSLFTAQQPSGNLGPSGAPDGTFVDVVGLVDIPCTAPPPSSARIQATEVKELEEIMAAQLKHVLLNGYYPTLEAGVQAGWQCIIDGVAYDMLGAESDSQGQMTHAEVRLASY